MTIKSKLKIKLKLEKLEFEIEGNIEDVKEQFENFQSFLLSKLLKKMNIKNTEKPLIEQQITPENYEQAPLKRSDFLSPNPPEISILNNNTVRDLIKNEAEWILIYCYLAADSYKNTFTRSDIVQLYKNTSRYSGKIANGLTQYLKNLSNKGFIKKSTDKGYLILEMGNQKAFRIFQRISKK